ncbi:MAG: 3-methyl-2-oxobutanoate hydroxymethyltransferase [Candidatus Dormibacteria bacterium]
MPVTVNDVRGYKAAGRRFAMVTAYDFPTARLLAEAEVPVILVGDSLGNNHLGYTSTLPVTMEEMLHHARAVARAAASQLLVGDMPFGSYHESLEQAVANAVAFVKSGMHAVKLEGGGWVADVVQRLTACGIPVMGHIGLTPQWVNSFGGFRVQGRSDADRHRILDEARALEEAGAFSLVLEGIPRDLAADITGAAGIPTIGIGAGPDCDAQVLVVYDLLGITRGRMPTFAKAYAPIGDMVVDAARAFAAEVAAGTFPDDEHSYH